MLCATGPETGDMGDHFYAIISCATESIWIATPYFIPNQAIQTALRIAASKGIQVRLMVPEPMTAFLPNMPRSPTFLNCCVLESKSIRIKKGFSIKKLSLSMATWHPLEPLIWICVVFI